MTKKILFNEEKFKSDVNRGMSIGDLSKKYYMKECTISKWKRRLGLVSEWKNKMPDKGVFSQEIKKYTNMQLAERYGVGVRLISKWRIKLGLANVWKKNVVDWNKFKENCKMLRLHELADMYQVSLSTIKLWKQERGLSAGSGKKESREVVFIKDKRGCWICTSHKVNANGYPQCKGEQLVVKRLWEKKNKQLWPKNLVCIHKCDNRWCVNPDHVYPGTMAQNQGGMAKRHRSPWGWRNGVRKLTPEGAKDVYDYKDSGLTQREVAQIFNISQATVCYIWKGDIWWRDVALIPNFDKKISKIKSGEMPKRIVIGSP